MTDMDFMRETDMEALIDYCQGDLILPIENLQSCGVSVDGIGLIHELLAAYPAEGPSAVRTLQHSWMAEVHLEDRTNARRDPNPAWEAMSAARLSVTEDRCFNHRSRFIAREKANFQVFHDHQALRQLALNAKVMVEKVFILGCEKAIAMQLSILVLYDIVMLIGPFSLLPCPE